MRKDYCTNISVVLCRVKESGNVGSVCRAMKTMGIADLVLADCPDYDEEKVRTMAVHAFDIFSSAKRCPTLAEALAGSSAAAGFTRRKGEKRKQVSLSLRDFVERTKTGGAGPISLVFGNEKDGLSDEELNECSIAVHIPSSEAFPSLNVSQAVQIACYEFFAAGGGNGNAPAADPAPRGYIDASVADIAASLSRLGFFKKSDDSYARRFFRDLCERAWLSKQEVDYLCRIFRKTAALAGGKANPRKKHSAGEER